MHNINNYGATIGIMYGSLKTPEKEPVDTTVGVEVRPPFNGDEQLMVENWIRSHSPSQLQHFTQMRHEVDASRYGVTAPFVRNEEIKRHVRVLAYAIRKALESAGRELDITEEVYN